MTINKITKIKKRDGRIVDFDQKKITNAIYKAITATDQGDGKKAKKLSDAVVRILNRRFKKDEIPTVEQIQDIVEEVLILEGLVETAKAYILYREQRRRIREATAVAEEAVDRIDKYLEKLDWEVQENANMTFSLQGLNHYGVTYIVKKYWLNKIYPKEIRDANEGGDFHLHNLDTLGCYTFFGKEVVITKLNNQIKLISLEDLYNKISQKEVLLNKKDGAYAKYPENVYVLDKNGWTKVLRMVRKKKDKEMRFVKSEQGRSVIVTSNHPFIIQREGKEMEVEASQVREKKDLAFSTYLPSLLQSEDLFSKRYIYLAEELVNKDYSDFFLEGFQLKDFIENWGGSLRVPGTLSTSNSVNSLDNHLELSEDLGYLVGIFIAEGNYDSWRLVISSDSEDIIEKVQRICNKLGVRSYVKINKERVKQISISSSTLKLVFEKVFEIRSLSRNKNLPLDILNYNLDFVRGVIAGIIDGDGSVDPKNKANSNSQILIRVSSRTLLEQLAILLQFLGVIARDRVSVEDIGKRNIFRGREIIQNYPIYGISFSKKKGIDFPSFKYQRAKIAKKHWRVEEYGWNNILNNKITTIPDKTIYDITTDSGTFLCNGLLVHNCMGWDLYDLLVKGFGGVSGKVECKPPRHFRTALGQVVNFLYTLQGECAGAVAFSNFDTLLAPFIRYDNLNYQQVKQALQEFLFNMAIPTRVGFQTPFSNITLDLRPSLAFEKMPVIIGGKPQKETYKEFAEEMKIFDRALYEVILEGDKNGRPFHFPIPTINITSDFPWDEPAFDGIFEASAKYGTNYFANYINSEMNPSDVRSMCLDGKEEILIRNSKKIRRLSIKEIVEAYKSKDFDEEGWTECKKEGNLEVLSLNPNTFKLEWSSVKRFLRIFDKEAVEITTEDGKKAVFSTKHPIPVFTPQGIQMKWAKDVKKGDYLLSLKKAKNNLSKEYQKIDDHLILNEDLAKILGYFVADGNYLFENRKGYTYFGQPKGLQFTFKTGDKENLELIKSLIKKVFNSTYKEKQDPRYNTYYLYIYNAEIARKLYNAGFKKYGRLPQILFNSPPRVIQSFLEFHFRGDGYEKRKEIHLNDLELSRDLVLFYSLIGQPVTYKLKKKSQRIYLQHSKSKTKKGSNWLNNPIITERIPAWLANGKRIPGFSKLRMIGFDTVEKYNSHTTESLKIKNSDIYITRVKEIKKKKFKTLKEFFDIELEKNHLFLHSLGQISFNCCRLRLNLNELHNRGGGGLFGSGSLTGSIGVVTIDLPRIGYLSKTKKEFFERLERVMDLAKESLEIKRKAIENFIEKGLYPYSRYYLSGVKKMRGTYYGNHFSTIGLVGMNEALLNFIGEDIGSKRGRKFALEVLDFMRNRLVKYQEETGNMYNLEATPAESTAYRLALKDKEKYPDIIAVGTKERPYYTNSSQLPVNYTDDIFKALKLQDEIQCRYTGGCIEKGNKVLTDKGLLNIEYIVENFEKLKPIKALSYNPEKKISEWDEIIKAVSIDVKKHNKIRIKGERNLDIVTSDWHPFFVLEKFRPRSTCPICGKKIKNINDFASHMRWNPICRQKYKTFPKYQVVEKRADELKVGDYILQNSYNLYPERKTKLNNDLMWLIGFFIGDGCISEFTDNRGGNRLRKYRVRFFSEHKNALEKVAKILNRYFDCQVSVIKNETRGNKLLREVSTSKKTVSNFFFTYGFKPGEKTYTVSIPKQVKENITKSNVYSLLSGLMDSDGHIDKKQGDFEYYTVSSELANDILEICSCAGIMISKIKKLIKKKNEVNIYRLRIPSYQMSIIRDKLTNVVHYSRIKRSLSNRKKRYLPVVRVQEVSKINVEDNQFYDLMTAKNHNYLAGKNCLVFIHNTVFHIFLGERIYDISAVKNLVRRIFEKFHLPYITLTPTFSICPVHGYIPGEHFYCPKCTIKQPCEVYTRVVGYYRPVQQFNEGKKEEFKQRKEFKAKNKFN